MALNISIYYSGTTYNLRCESISHSFTRMPAQSGLPANDSNSDPQVMVLDMGVCTQMISLRGLVNTASDCDENDPSKANLETAIKRWFVTTPTTSNMIRITNAGTSYYGAIKSANFVQVAGQEDRWEFDILFVIGNFSG